MSLQTTIADITTRLRQGKFPNEQAISQGIILRVFSELNWDTWDANIVWPEYQTGKGRAESTTEKNTSMRRIKTNLPVRNGVHQPKEGTLIRTIWDMADKLTAKKKAACKAQGSSRGSAEREVFHLAHSIFSLAKLSWHQRTPLLKYSNSPRRISALPGTPALPLGTPSFHLAHV